MSNSIAFAFAPGQFVVVPGTKGHPGQVLEQINSLLSGKRYMIEFKNEMAQALMASFSEADLLEAAHAPR